MKLITLLIFLLLLSGNVYAQDMDDLSRVEKNTQYAFNFGSWFGFGQGGSGTPAAETYYVLLETGDGELLETGDHLLKEDTP